MPLTLFRIDDRLIHGQVVVGWVNALKADYIIVVNDAAAENEFQKSLLKMAVPPQIKVDIFSVSEFNLKPDSKELLARRVIILTSNPLDCLRLYEKGFKMEEINLGGMRHSKNKKRYTNCIYLNEEDIAVFNKLIEKGVRVTVRMVPSDAGKELGECLLKGGCALEKD
ncbi:MAG: PTS sugar transporter subunit IIB [Candidatus Firestonebacteria bacterium]|nr:PTS sugar transporter subunit IIB [Candidatus Firestonebacteria bacterium]